MNKILGIIIILFILASCKASNTCPAYYGNNKLTLKQQKYQQYMFERNDICKKYNTRYKDKYWRKKSHKIFYSIK